MKKILLLTTALLTPVLANAAEPLKVTVGGFMQFNAGMVNDKNDAAMRGYEFETDTELYVNATAKSDSGLKYGVRIQLEADQDTTAASDEAVIFAESQYGLLELGDEDGASDRMTVYAPADFGTGGVFTAESDYSHFASGRSLRTLEYTYKPVDTSDATKISWFTPRMYNFQMGMSFVPDGNSVGTNVGRSKLGTYTSNEPYGVANTTNPDTILGNYANIMEMALDYKGKFSNVDYAVSASYVSGASKRAANNSASPIKSLTSAGVGASFKFSGWTVGGGYVDSFDSGYLRSAATVDDDDAVSWNLGIQYETGPWVLGTNYINAKSEGLATTVANDEYKAWAVGATYKVAPGFATYAEVVNFDYNEETAVAAASNEGSVVVVGARIDF